MLLRTRATLRRAFSQLRRVELSGPASIVTAPEGSWYTVPREDEHLFNLYRGILRSSHVSQTKAFNETSFMVRRPARELVHYLQNADYDLPNNRYVLYGRGGSGKTTTLAQTIHYAISEGWLVLHMRYLRYWSSRKLKNDYVEYSAYPETPGVIDQPIFGQEWLQHFAQLNKGWLAKHSPATTVEEYTWSPRDSSPIGTPWSELLQLNESRPRFSCDIVGALWSEIRKTAAQKNWRVLVAVDAVNECFNETRIRNMTNLVVPRYYHKPSNIALFRGLLRLIGNDWAGGAVVATVDPYCDRKKTGQYTPLYLLGDEGFETMDPFIPVHIPEYSAAEVDSSMAYYADRGWLTCDSKAASEIAVIAANNPFLINQIVGTV